MGMEVIILTTIRMMDYFNLWSLALHRMEVKSIPNISIKYWISTKIIFKILETMVITMYKQKAVVSALAICKAKWAALTPEKLISTIDIKGQRCRDHHLDSSRNRLLTSLKMIMDNHLNTQHSSINNKLINRIIPIFRIGAQIKGTIQILKKMD